MSRYTEICGCIHIHFPVSLMEKGTELIGNEAERSSIDFLIINNHTPQRKKEKYSGIFKSEGYYGKCLVIVGEEVDDNLKKENHLLVIGNRDWIGRRPFDDVLSDIKRNKFLSFIAHPDGSHRLFLVKKEYKWRYFSFNDFTGIEIWSLLFDWASKTNPVNLPLRYFSFPDNLKGPSDYVLSLWDRLSFKRKTVGICGLDIHLLPFPFLDIKRKFRYKNIFKILRNHLLLRNPLSGDFINDKNVILETLKKGNLFFSNDFLKNSKGFYFGCPEGKFTMGDEIEREREGIVVVPYKAYIRIIKDGKIFWQGEGIERKIIFSEKGNYRVEVYIDNKSWIYSNIIRVK